MEQKIKAIMQLLDREYPHARTELNYTTPFELLIATILSAQCTDERVNKLTRNLFQKYREPSDYLHVPLEELERDIRPTGFFRNKARAITGICHKIVNEYGGNMPSLFEQLINLPGVARKTANVVMGNAFGKATGIAVDTHVQRVSRRLGLTTEKNPEKIEKDLCRLFPKKKWIDISHQLILLGRYVCKARKPDHDRCILKEICPRLMES